MPRSKTKPVQPVEHETTWLNHAQASAYLHITTRTLDQWRADGRHSIPCYRIGGRYYYKQTDLDVYIEACKVGA